MKPLFFIIAIKNLLLDEYRLFFHSPKNMDKSIEKSVGSQTLKERRLLSPTHAIRRRPRVKTLTV